MTTIGNTIRHGFTGHEHLDSVSLIHMNGRVYDPTVGRFLSVDPIIGDLADSQSVNPFAYVGNRPLTDTDPSGLCPADGCSFVVYIVVDIVGFVKSLFGGGGPPPPPPATSFPGISAQDGVMECGPGSSSPACTGLILSVTAAPSAEPTPISGRILLPYPILPLPPMVVWRPGSPEYETASILVGHTGDVLKEIGCHLKVPICGIPQRPADDPARSSTSTLLVMTAYVLDRWLDPPWMNSSSDAADPPVPGAKPGRKTKGRSKIWDKDGDFQDALGDFEAKSPQDVVDLPDGGRRGTLSDGRTIIVRPTSTDGRAPTVEIQDGKTRTKVRYRR